MAEFPPSPSYPNYASLLSNLIGNLPGDYRNAQQQQTQIDISNAFKGGFPMNSDGTPNWAAAMQKFGQAGGATQAADLGPLAQQQAWQQGAPGTMSPLLGGGAGQPATPPPAAPMQLPSAPVQAPSPAPPQPQPGAPPPPTLAALVSSVAPDPAKGAAVMKMLANILGVDPTAPLTPAQVARAQRIMSAAKLGPSAPGQLSAPVRWDLMPDQAATVGTPQPEAARDIATKETVAYGAPQRNLTQAEATAIATGNSPGTGGGAGTPFGLPPAAEAVWQRMVPQESGGKQFNADGSVVTSPTGAIGIAQVEPGTGPAAAKLAGLPWDPVRFKNDPNYNLALGRAYFAQQVQAFGSPDVAAAAYNAGPNAVLAAQAKASKRGGDWLSYMPAETRDYVAKVTGGGGAPVARGQGGAQGNRPIVPQVPLPPGITDPQQAILAIDREIAKASTNPNPYAQGQVAALSDWRNRIAESVAPVKLGPTETILPAQGGPPLAQGPFASGQGTLSPAALDDAAETALKTGKPPANIGRGVQGAQNLAAVYNRAAELAAERGIDPQKLADLQQGFNARPAGLRSVFQRATGLTLVENEANRLLPRVRDLLPKLNHTDYPTLNAAINAYAKQTGDPNIVKFHISAASLANVYARVLKGGGTPTGGETDHALGLLDEAWSKGQIEAALDQINIELQSAKGGVNDTLSEFGLSMSDIPGAGFAPQGGASPTAAAPAQSATGGAGQPARVTKEQYDALPKGAPFIAVDDPTQTPRTKP
jgi:hypothetical protein